MASRLGSSSIALCLTPGIPSTLKLNAVIVVPRRRYPRFEQALGIRRVVDVIRPRFDSWFAFFLRKPVANGFRHVQRLLCGERESHQSVVYPYGEVHFLPALKFSE